MQGIIKDAQARAARLYGADQTWFLVMEVPAGFWFSGCSDASRGSSPSTVTVLARRHMVLMWTDNLVTAAAVFFVARNCHKSVYHSIFLNRLIRFMCIQIHEHYGIVAFIEPQEIARLFEKYPDIQAVIMTSPTYEGVVSDIASIARIVHEKGLAAYCD